MSVKWLYLAALLILTGYFSSCSEKEKIPFTTMSIGSNLDFKAGIPKQDVIIRSQVEWDDLIAVMGNRFIETEIDFDRYQIVAVVHEVLNSGGFEITITKITDYSDKILVTVKLSASKGVASEIFTQPYHFVKMCKTAKRIEFKHINNTVKK